MTLINSITPSQGSKGAFASDAPADADSAKQVLVEAMQSGSGLVRLTTQAYNAAETNALTLLTGSADELGPNIAALANEKLGSALADDDTFDDLVTAIGAS